MANIESKAQWVADIIDTLRLTEAFIEAHENGDTELADKITEVALAEITKKIEKIQTKLMTDKRARKDFDLMIYGLAA